MVKNFSYTYLLPLLSEQVNLKKKILVNIVNTYVITNKNENLGKFYILCKFDYSDKEFTNLEKILTTNDLYNTSYQIDNKILYEFNFPKVYIFEQKKFVNGKYSEFKDDAKKLILEYWAELYGHIPSFVNTSLLRIKQILYKDKKLKLKLEKELSTSGKGLVKLNKNAELGSKIEKKDETFFFEEEKKEKVNLKNIKDIFE